MGTVNIIVVVQSIQDLAKKEGDELHKFHLPSIIAVGIALGMSLACVSCIHPDLNSLRVSGVKFALFVYSFSIRKQSSQVLVLWKDHRNDLFINGFGILMATGGSKLKWCTYPVCLHPDP